MINQYSVQVTKIQAFITATDTNVGKTFFTRLLLRSAKEKGRNPMALKPVCTGGDQDVRSLLAELPENVSPHDINFLCFPQPAAPSVAAKLSGQNIPIDELVQWSKNKLAEYPVCFVEGAGGWLVPIAQGWCIANLAAELAIPVLLLVPDRLGCGNHTALTAFHMKAIGVRLAGIILNQLPDDQPKAADSNADLIRDSFELPVLGTLPANASSLPPQLDDAIWKALESND